MKIAIIGQQDFGKAVLEAFLARKDEVAGVFCAPEKPGARPDALKVAAQEKGVPLFQFQSLKGEEAKSALKKLNVELGIMAFVLQFAPQAASETVYKVLESAVANAEGTEDLDRATLVVTKATVDEGMKSTNPDVKRLLGTEGNYGEQLGLTKDWAYRIIKHVGNYGEVFEKNVGQGSPLKIARGVNGLWTKGGLQYAPPIR